MFIEKLVNIGVNQNVNICVHFLLSMPVNEIFVLISCPPSTSVMNDTQLSTQAGQLYWPSLLWRSFTRSYFSAETLLAVFMGSHQESTDLSMHIYSWNMG